MESVWSVSKLSTESRELVANRVHTADADATKQFRRVGIGGVYWALDQGLQMFWRQNVWPTDVSVISFSEMNIW